MTNRFDRRRFLEKLGLGAGAVLLAPVAESLVSEAYGQAPTRKRVVFFVCGNGLSTGNLTPADIKSGDDPVLDGPRGYAWPTMLAPLAGVRNRMLLVDGLANVARVGGVGHSMGYGALTGVKGANGNQARPGGPSIDQYIAERIGGSTLRKSVLFGVSGGVTAAHMTQVFAGGPSRPEPFFLDPSRLYDDLFGSLATDASGANTGKRARQALLDSLRVDIKRLGAALAGPERMKLDVYLGAIDDFQQREKALQATACVPGPHPGGSTMRYEDELASMNEMGTLALACGLTNVVGVSCLTGNPHSFFPVWKKNTEGTPHAEGFNGNIGHAAGSVYQSAMDIVHGYNASLIARTVDTLSKIKEGNGTAFDNTVIVYMSDNAEHHHAAHKRWPLYVVGNAGGKLKADGRFLRYPKKGLAGSRSVADFFCTIATAVGAPTDSFASEKQGGWEPVKGPLPELLA